MQKEKQGGVSVISTDRRRPTQHQRRLSTIAKHLRVVEFKMNLSTNAFVVVISIITHIVSTDLQCCDNLQCRCVMHEDYSVMADCSNLGLKSSPKFYENVSVINLSNNKLTSLPSTERFSRKLRELDMSSNDIQKFHGDSFKGLNSLTFLNLKDNRIPLNPQVYIPGLFVDLTNLTHINLKGNAEHENGDHEYPDQVFKDLISLESLLIDGLQQTDFGPGFSSLQILHHLDLSGITGTCRIEILKSSTFQNLKNLRYLDVSKCSLQEIGEGTFAPLSKLTHLDISYNENLTFYVLQNVTRDLRNTSIKSFRLDKIHCTHGLGRQILISDIEALQETNLTEISVSSNRIQMVQYGAIRKMPKTLRHITMADNILDFGLYAFESQFLSSTEIANFSSQYTSHSPGDTECGDTTNENARECKTKNSSELLQQSSFQCDTLSGLMGTHSVPFCVPPNIKHVYYNKSSLHYSIPAITLGPNKIESIFIQDNVLSEWIGPIGNIASLKTLNLSNNYCSRISSFFFDGLRNLRELYIKGNLLGLNISATSDNGTFKDLSKLQHLDISDNRIESLPFLIFGNMYALQQLVISDNVLKNWNVQFSNMKRLEFLDLSGNLISSLTPKIMNIFDELSATGNLTVDLSRNPLQCNCDTITFLRWMANHAGVKFRKFKIYTCSRKDGKLIQFDKLSDEIIELEKQCSSYTGLITGLTVGILFFVAILICGVVYRYRWKLRYLFYMTKNKYRGYSAVGRTEDHYVYDAFISYADEDRDFAVLEMKAHLEEEEGLRLCLHHRDFLPGNDIAENITNAIHSSRKTVCVLSENFVKSYWCTFEFNMARMESIYSRNGEEVLFLVFYKTVAAQDMPLQIMQHIENRSFIEYPNDPEGNVVFWDKIKETLS